MSEPALVSIIIPALNEENFIESLLQNLLAIPNTEIIVSDGGSSDNTGAICAGYPVKFISSSRGRGPQLNAGAAAAAGEILFFVHADSVIEPQLINEIRQAVKAGHHWGCCSLAFDNTALIFRIIAGLSNLRALLFSSCYGDQGIYCDRALFYKVGPYPPAVFLEDMALSDRLRRSSRARVLKGRIGSSSRRFTRHGVWRTIVKMQAIKIMYRLGGKPESLVKWYHPGYEEQL
ncbi:MAG: TIGR04283 family arsenosugar biosynthesis glycosyltransferase [Syntrophomonas sp.]